MTIENPIKLSAKSRRKLYLSNREQVTKDNPEILPEFDRLHDLQMQEFPRLHEFRLGWLCAVKHLSGLLSQITSSPESGQPSEKVVIEKAMLEAWVDAVLQASAKINHLESLVNSLVEYPKESTMKKSPTIEQAIAELKGLLSLGGKYSVCRKDKQPMGLGDQLIVGEALKELINFSTLASQK